ncbi:LysR family transcriptional regulator [Pseudomonas sp. TH39(2020)]|uniref:LysR family transcriptional regulator n=1 Tax=Pseudomonas sp. TH39(2020) TaxID=2796349 RepID=UPI0019133AAE|nr:LysR family transcriptional regulator [Pseudomonas sp. TH39(2020)]MBK5395927.1 LysR family transcriptional regulator [Pseudomonas sp. TH39(2020)]
MNKINNSVSLEKLDLNLFRVFAIIYQERNLTRAAERLCVSQSAVSHALARMREQLEDPLFVRESQGVLPTPLAKRIWPDVEEGLRYFQRASRRSENFDPARDVEQIALAMNDEVEPTLLPILVSALHQEASNIRIASVRVDRSSLKSDLATGKLDCVIDVAQAADEQLMHTSLTKDDFVVVSRNPGVIDHASYLAAEHVTVSSRRAGRSLEDWELARLGIHRRITVRAQHYQSAYRLVAESNLLLTIPRSLALELNVVFNNHIHELPVPIPPVELHMFWHKERDKNPANVWLRNTVLKALGAGLIHLDP